LLDKGAQATIKDVAKAKRLPPSYVSGILRLTLLASEIVEAVLDGRQPAEMQLRDLMEGVTIDWSQQHRFRTSLPAR
jgi:hypothetical protein